MAKLDSVKDRLREKGAKVINWWDANKWGILKTAGETVMYGLIGYGIGSLYLDASGIRKTTYFVTHADGFADGYVQGLTDAAGALRAPATKPVVIQTK